MAGCIWHSALQFRCRMTSHWGEYPAPDGDCGLTALDTVTSMRPLELEGPRLHQPSKRHYPPSNEAQTQFGMDPRVVHTIQLLQHARILRQLINNIQSSQQECVDFKVSYQDAPALPTFTGDDPPANKTQSPLAFVAQHTDNAGVRVMGEAPLEVDSVTCRSLLRKSVAAILAHTGYDVCGESVLETLTDVTSEFYLQLTRHMRAAADNLALHDASGFPDILEQVLQELGLGSVCGLHEFYEQRVVRYQRHMQDVCRQLVTQYDKLKEPILQQQQQQQPDTLSVIRIKEEPSEIHFPELDEIDEANNGEHLLNLNDLGGFEITVEHESASGLTTEVESKWSAVKSETNENKMTGYEPMEEEERVVKSVASSEQDEAGTDSQSVNVSDIMSPTANFNKTKKK
ncbi:STAGA complex 65 subunit gamma-like isoform X2 [Dreissena polymorpha]|uniref:STAGA complex 65 subunit gamma-like isoform X2 n=1 Tax=Dreissena polymorpha TaxID=45954 RepID=UPI0022654B84|nr:STAGA complex 65 subunit gamma-like isoform X2 [Dreissena polymorpha]